jgi:CheY-like chemotaxis protein
MFRKKIKGGQQHLRGVAETEESQRFLVSLFFLLGAAGAGMQSLAERLFGYLGSRGVAVDSYRYYQEGHVQGIEITFLVEGLPQQRVLNKARTIACEIEQRISPGFITRDSRKGNEGIVVTVALPSVKLHSILVVDDEEPSLNALGRTFRDEYNVFSAASGEDALDILENEDITVIIADHRMPGMTGVEFLEKARQKSPDAIRIILTAHIGEELLMDAVNRVHAHGFVTKPWTPERIRDIVRRWITSVERQRDQQLREKDEQIEDLQAQLAEVEKVNEQLMEGIAKLHRELTVLEFSQAESRQRVGEILMEMGCLTNSQLERFLEKQKAERESKRPEHPQRRLGEILLEAGAITEEELRKALAEQTRRRRLMKTTN